MFRLEFNFLHIVHSFSTNLDTLSQAIKENHVDFQSRYMEAFMPFVPRLNNCSYVYWSGMKGQLSSLKMA